MNRLKITSRSIKGISDIIVLDLEGVFDESVVGLFQDFWKALSEKKYQGIIINFRQVAAISNFGVGFVASLIEHSNHNCGEIKLANVPANIKRTFLHIVPRFKQLRFYDDEAAALSPILPPLQNAFFDHFILIPETQEIVSGLPFILRVEARDSEGGLFTRYSGTPHLSADKGMASPTLLSNMKNGIWSGDVILTGPGDVAIRVWDDEGQGENRVFVVEKGDCAEFPIEVECPGCRRINMAGKADIFRCVKCNQIYFIDVRGRIIPLKPGSNSNFVKELEFKIPSDINYLNHVRKFIVGVSREESIDEEKIAQVEMALDEALANVVEHAYTFDCHQEIQVKVSLHPNRLVIVIRDHGRSFNSENTPLPNIKEHIEQRRVGGLGRYLMMTLMDEVEYRSDAFGNELRMMKKIC